MIKTSIFLIFLSAFFCKMHKNKGHTTTRNYLFRDLSAFMKADIFLTS